MKPSNLIIHVLPENRDIVFAAIQRVILQTGGQYNKRNSKKLKGRVLELISVWSHDKIKMETKKTKSDLFELRYWRVKNPKQVIMEACRAGASCAQARRASFKGF